MVMAIHVCAIFLWLFVFLTLVSPIPKYVGNPHLTVFLALVGTTGIAGTLSLQTILVAITWNPPAGDVLWLMFLQMALVPIRAAAMVDIWPMDHISLRYWTALVVLCMVATLRLGCLQIKVR
jgi:hypothetical protein